ncbi:MAG: low molecular weight protein-tyrosine-phosphatase [Flavobacteriales bacterium]|jgi:protein-tyrosine phosphatase|tara:strand:+ start:3854 stop:4327 length:474 start_codon:yes stop_codon:yes gene_type:complete
MKQKTILMVCLGNICRSPLAEGILAAKCEHLPVVVDSAGTSAHHIGEGPDHRSVHIATINGIDIGDQRARKLMKSDLEDFDLIFAMDSANYNNILKLASTDEDREKVKLILNESSPGQNKAVPDPYYGGDQGFENVFNLLDEACELVKNQLEKEFDV